MNISFVKSDDNQSYYMYDAQHNCIVATCDIDKDPTNPWSWHFNDSFTTPLQKHIRILPLVRYTKEKNVVVEIVIVRCIDISDGRDS